LKGGPEAAAERLVKETDGGEIKKIELERKHAQPVPGEPGSGMERGSAATTAQVKRVQCSCFCFTPSALLLVIACCRFW
jgi:hypothetical protein